MQLQLPRPLREAKSRHQLSSLALLGQEFWGYPMANPKNNPSTILSPCHLANGVVPMAVTPSDTGSSLSNFNINGKDLEIIIMLIQSRRKFTSLLNITKILSL